MRKLFRMRESDRRLVLAFLFSLAALWVSHLGREAVPLPCREAMVAAAETMKEAISAIRQARISRGIPIDPRYDPNRTGLIGMDFTPTTTTVGSLAAKRTATSPEAAALLVRLLTEAGVGQGDVVAIGASGSFPGFIVATLSACKALGVTPILITSLGASSWGANIPEFTWLDMEQALADAGVFEWKSVAVSLGGDDDQGGGLPGEGVEALKDAVARASVLSGAGGPPWGDDSSTASRVDLWATSGADRSTAPNPEGPVFIADSSIDRSVEIRMQTYKAAARGHRLAAFVNIGGASANVGTSAAFLKVKPGLHLTLPPCLEQGKGVMFRMSEDGVPVIHLLHVEGLAQNYGLRFDPIPLPEPGEGKVYYRERFPRWFPHLILAVYSAGLVAIARWRATLFLRFFQSSRSHMRRPAGAFGRK